MPEYTYECDKCQSVFSVICSISNYNEHPKCDACSSKKTHRRYLEDCSTINSSVRLGDNELKTLGDLAQRNTERMSDDEKRHIYEKNNAYKQTQSTNALPTGMSRLKKPKKPPKNFIERLK
jgi:putative FmdB family regulatory protein